MKKGVRRGTTSSQADPIEDEFVDSWDEQINFKKYKEVQETFWQDCTYAYYFGLTDTKFVSIDQCFCSEDGSINVRALEQHILSGMVNWLAKIGDINQCQKIYLIPCDNNLRLLPEHPTSWEDIKNGKFLIVNGQHSMEASKLLQERLSYSERRKDEVMEWDAYIVWSNNKISFSLYLSSITSAMEWTKL